MDKRLIEYRRAGSIPIPDTEGDVCSVMLMFRGYLVLCWNRLAENWDLPQSFIRAGETGADSARRAVEERLSQTADSLIEIGEAQVFDGFTGVRSRIRVFFGDITDMRDFLVFDEKMAIALWDFESKLENMNPLVEHLARLAVGNTSS